MEIKKFQKCKDNRYKVIFDNELELKLYDDIIVKYNLLVNKKFDENKFKEITKDNDSLEAYYKALKYLNVKLRSKVEIKKYLKRFFDDKTINNTIEKLEQEGYLNEDIYVKAYINDALNLTINGPYKIAKNLRDLGLKEDKVLKELDKVANNVWDNKIEKIIDKKVKTNHKLSLLSLKKKLSQDLYQLGYSKEMFEKFLDNIKLGNTEEIFFKEAEKIYQKYSKKYDKDKTIFVFRQKMYQKGFEGELINEFLVKKNGTNY